MIDYQRNYYIKYKERILQQQKKYRSNPLVIDKHTKWKRQYRAKLARERNKRFR